MGGSQPNMPAPPYYIQTNISGPQTGDRSPLSWLSTLPWLASLRWLFLWLFLCCFGNLAFEVPTFVTAVLTFLTPREGILLGSGARGGKSGGEDGDGGGDIRRIYTLVASEWVRD